MHLFLWGKKYWTSQSELLNWAVEKPSAPVPPKYVQGFPGRKVGGRDKSCTSESAENECGLWESSSCLCPACVLFILINTILDINFHCVGKWWVRGLSQLLPSSLDVYTGDKRQELARNGGLNSREKMFKTSFSQFSVWWLIRGQWSKPQCNWQSPCRCPGRPWPSTLAQVPSALSPSESGSRGSASPLQPLCHGLHSSQRLLSPHGASRGGWRDKEGRGGGTLRGTDVAPAWKNT